VPFKNSAARDVLLPRQVQRLCATYRDLFGEDLPQIAHAWGGSFAATADGLPFIGSVPGMHPRLQFALCFGGNGITFSSQAGEIIRAAVENRPNALAEVFGFGRGKLRHQSRGDNFRDAKKLSVRAGD
jgi:glycine/D-amino acid oxidase-like deaminating enzyme